MIEGPRDIEHLEVSSESDRLEAYVIADESLTTWVWSLESGIARLLRRFECGPPHGTWSDFLTMDWDASRRLFAKGGPGKVTRLWSLSVPSDAEPLVLRRGAVLYTIRPSIHPNGRWLATAQMPGLSLWPLSRDYPWVIRAHTNSVSRVVFGPDGKWLASGSESGMVRLTPLAGEVPETTSFVYDGSAYVRGLAASPDGRMLLVGREYLGAVLVPLDGGPPADLGALIHADGVAFSPDGRFAAVSGWEEDSEGRLHVFTTDTLEEVADIDTVDTATRRNGFLPDGRVLSAGVAGLRVSDPATGDSEVLFDGFCTMFAASADGRRIAVVARASEDYFSESRVILLDLEAGTETHLASYGVGVYSVAVNATGSTIATGDRDGVMRVGSVDGSEPHLLLGHEGFVWDVELDPLGRWIASGGEDTTVRIWPMPDLSKPPLHTLPHDELLAKLKTLTNLRVVRDEADPTGWTLTHDPFPGWETVPTW